MADDSASYNLDLYNKLTETVSLELEGDYRIRARDTVSVNEPFTEMSGDLWFVYAATHRIDKSGYTTRINLSR